VNVADGPDLEVQGNILDHEYTIGEGRDKIAEVSKKWFRVADTYGVQIEQGQNDALVLAVTVAMMRWRTPVADTKISLSVLRAAHTEGEHRVHPQSTMC
jgi:hypothetical protein